MARLSLTCPQCKLDMMVPENAIGRNGLCPECGTAIPIREDNTRPYKRRRPQSNALAPLAKPRESTGNGEDSWRQFATAVDLYNQRRYAEALTLLSELQDVFPGNPHVADAQEQCLRALRDVIDPGRRYAEPDTDAAQLTPDLVRRVVLDKMLNGESDDIQLRAAALAATFLDMNQPAAPTAPNPKSAPDENSPDIILDPEPEIPEEIISVKPAPAKRKSRAKAAPRKKKPRGRPPKE